MILYNTLMGFCAGLILLSVSMILFRADVAGPTVAIAGKRDAVRLLILGTPLTVLSGAMTLSWPLKVNPPINIVFSEPALMLGLLAVAGGIVICTARMSVTLAYAGTFTPLIGSLGLMMLAISAAILRFDLVGDAPSIEPITGQFTGWENTTFGSVYLITAIGCLATLFSRRHRVARTVAAWSWAIAGVFFLLFSCLNYYTHIGLLVCSGTGTCHSF